LEFPACSLQPNIYISMLGLSWHYVPRSAAWCACTMCAHYHIVSQLSDLELFVVSQVGSSPQAGSFSAEMMLSGMPCWQMKQLL
jgi:hypothetical protein